MKWSFTIARIAGIPIKIHATFFLLLLFVAIVHAGEGGQGIFLGLIFILALFACVVLHELGHSLVAMQYGIKVRDITLLPIGGVAALERMPENPRHEFLVAVAGPLVNLAIAAGLYVILSSFGTLVPIGSLSVTEGSLFERLMVVNVFLAAFNMLPAFPMDGGRMLRALMAHRMDYTRATQLAARIGQGMALFFGLVGLLFNPFLIFIALFVYIGAEQEAAMVTMRAAFRGGPVRDAMIRDFRSLHFHDPLTFAVQYLLEGSQQDFPVLDDSENVMGVLTRADLLAGLSRGNDRAPVGALVRADVGTLSPGDTLDDSFARLQRAGTTALPVVDKGRLVGLLTLENISEYVMIHNARLRSRRD
ncbi:MAG: site-2 protease family protein [Deltaproteobacteria bacterium]|nr:site-2 protease family protein [Deltaproteobacteria bacterium]